MSASERRLRRTGWHPEIEGREEFVRDNAASLLKQRDMTAGRLRNRIRQLEQGNQEYRRIIRALRDCFNIDNDQYSNAVRVRRAS